MLVKVLRRLILEEVEEQIRNFEKVYRMSFDEFEESFLTKAANQRCVDDYFKWSNLVDALRGYMEGGELECVVEESHDLNLQELKALTPKRLELLYALSDLKIESINDLASKVHRDVKNVYQDLQVLKKLGFVHLNRKGRRSLVPEVLVEEITFSIR